MDRSPTRLPRGPHRLTRGEVERSQRDRLLVAMAEAMWERGYVDTSVADVLKRAGVSRESFYRLFSSKQDCFMTALDVASELLVAHLGGSATRAGSPIERFEKAVTAYLNALATEPAFARLFIVEVNAAGPEAMRRRAEMQDAIVDQLGRLLGSRTDEGRFSCQVLVAAMSAMVTVPLATGDADALRALGPPLVTHVRAAWERGAYR